MNYILPSLDGADIGGKKVLVRCDFDVPLSPQGEIEDESRLISGISTIEYLLEKGCSVTAIGHLGRPSNNDPKLSLEPVAKWYAQEFPESSLEKVKLGEFDAWKIKENFYILENLRYEAGEEENSPDFSAKLAELGEIYVNEAFGASHRQHASIVGLPNLLPRFGGFHLLKEVKVLSLVTDSPKRPLTIIVGGAKIETKLPLISHMHSFADYVLVGGELAEETQALIKEEHARVSGQKAQIIVADLNPEKSDITNESLEGFKSIISQSQTVVWNGPMGDLQKDFTGSSLKLAQAIIESSAYKVVGGGDTVGFLNKNNLLDKFDFVSMGGGAMLQFLSGIELPGLAVLSK